MTTPPPISARRRWWDVFQAVSDAVAVGIATVAAQLAVGGGGPDAWASAVMVVLGFFIAAQVTGLHPHQEGGSADREMAKIGATWALTVPPVLAFTLLYPDTHPAAWGRWPLSLIGLWLLVTPAWVGCQRMSLRIVRQGLLRYGLGGRRVAIAGLNRLGQQTAENIAEDVSLGFHLVGMYDDRRLDRNAAGPRPGQEDLPESERDIPETLRDGTLDDLVRLARQGRVDTVLVTLPMRAEGRIRYLLDQLSDSTVSVYIVPDFFVFELLHSRWTHVGGLPAVSVFENPLFGVDGVAKRSADILLASLALLLAAVPMTIIAIAIKLTSPGPVFFRQTRYGLDGREIRVWKFRSMTVCEDGSEIRQAVRGDARITPLGELLRRSSLDELPQLFNVLEGSMSLVGPRPHATAHNEQYRGLIRGYMLRHKVKPGITGLAQVNGCRGETDTLEKMRQRVEWDHRYIRTWSLWLDLKILVRTVGIVSRQTNAY